MAIGREASRQGIDTDHPGDDVEAAGRRWRAAEARLYPLIATDADLYRSAVTLVVEAREVLRRTCPDTVALIAAEPSAVLARCPSAAAVRDYGFDTEIAFDAARAQRLRELG